MKIEYSPITDSRVTEFKEDLKKALAEISKKHGVTIRIGPLRYNALSIRLRIAALAVTGKQLLTIGMEIFGLVKTSNKGYTLLEFDPKNKKYPFVVSRVGFKYNQRISGLKAVTIFGNPVNLTDISGSVREANDSLRDLSE